MNDIVTDHKLCPAKTYIDQDGNTQLGFNVVDHTFIVGLVAKALIQIMPKFLRENFFPKGTELIAACHDIGKVSPTFYLKLSSNVFSKENLPAQVVKKYFHNKDNENKLWGGHATVSAITLKEILNDKHIFKIVGSHHGSLHPNLRLLDFDGFDFGGESWHEMRIQVIEELKQRLDCEFPKIESDMQAKILSGFTTVADWIGSGGVLAQPTEMWQQNLEQNIQLTLAEAGFHPVDIKRDLTFAQIFGENFTPNTMQSLIYEHGIVNGLNIVEAPMGVGKTESALYLAYKALNLNHATGIYFALPTQLTSNMIYGRFNDFLQNILNNSHQKSQLSHSNAWLVKTSMGEEGDVGGSWFDGNKRGLLAPYGVGTIDQALLSVINVRHNFVRSFGLAGKVVILDEVHSYDVFTGLLLDELIKQLLDMKCTVIVLSATLTKERREQLIPQSYSASAQAYPLITTYNPETKQVKEHTFETGAPEKIINFALKKRHDCYEEALNRLEQGQYVLWIENTVNEATETFKKFKILAQDLGFECGLLHSKFTYHDRQEIEHKWVSEFGKHNPDRYKTGGKILIGTQILEQSLDIDSDYMVTNLAPMDLLLQRTGRLWRHSRPHRPTMNCDFHIISEPYQDCYQSIDKLGASAFIYYPYVLLKTLRILELHNRNLDTLSLPKHIPELMNLTYTQTDAVIENELNTYWSEMFNGNKFRNGINALRQKALANISKFGMPISKDDEAKTRNIDEESCELIILKDIHAQGSSITKLALLNDEVLTIPSSPNEQKQLSLTLFNQGIKVGQHKVIHDLAQEPPPKNLSFIGRRPPFPIICILDDNNNLVHWSGKNLSEKYQFNYNSTLGLVTKKLR